MRNGGRRQASSPPSNLTAYRRTLSQVFGTAHPVVLVVENEENSALFSSGAPEDDTVELEAACQA